MSNCAAQKSNSSIESPEYGPAFINTGGEELTATPEGVARNTQTLISGFCLMAGRRLSLCFSRLQSMMNELCILHQIALIPGQCCSDSAVVTVSSRLRPLGLMKL